MSLMSNWLKRTENLQVLAWGVLSKIETSGQSEPKIKWGFVGKIMQCYDEKSVVSTKTETI